MADYHHIYFNELSLALCTCIHIVQAIMALKDSIFTSQKAFFSRTAGFLHCLWRNLSCIQPTCQLFWLKAKTKPHLEVKGHAHSFSSFSASPLSGLKPRPMAPISECGRPADRLVNIHEKATSLMIPTCSERWRGQRKWPLTGHRVTQGAWTLFSASHNKIVTVPDS